jgi:hypothetical protein
MARVVLDIETLAFPLTSFDAAQQEYLLRFATTDAERAETIQKLNLYPLTAQIIAIGMLNPDTGRGKILYQADVPGEEMSKDGTIQFTAADEKEIVSRFWDDIAHYEQFITFNGRGFDCPFLMIRSSLLGVRPSRNLMPYRYDPAIHCDLLEQLTYYGATRKFNLDFYCKAYGIESPKSHGVTGLDLARLWEEKRFSEVAQYCLGDVVATAELFRRWERYLNFSK